MSSTQIIYEFDFIQFLFTIFMISIKGKNYIIDPSQTFQEVPKKFLHLQT